MPQKLLLDTHIWVWSLSQPQKLSRRIARALDTPANEQWISPVSSWEILMLCQKKRLFPQPDGPRWIASVLAAMVWREAPVTHEVALAVDNVFLPHGDPFDRLLAATARVYNLTLVTADENILGGSGYSVLANT